MRHLLLLRVVLVAICSTDLLIFSLRLQPYRVSFILGGPAAGKSTQCKKLVDDYGCMHLSAGDLLREERASGSSTATLIESYIKEGAIVPVDITLELIRYSMGNSKASRFLIDGFPRNEDNLLGWTKIMTEDSCIVDSIIFIECPEEECTRRIIERAKTSGRSDDNLETLKKRFVTFNEITLPVIKNFEQASKTSQTKGNTGSSTSQTNGNNGSGISQTNGNTSSGIDSSNSKDSNEIKRSTSNNKSKKNVYRVAGDRDIESVYSDIRIAYEDMVTAELLQMTEKLLNAEDNGDLETYKSLQHKDCTFICDKNTFKSDLDRLRSGPGVGSGLGVKQSTMSRPHVRIMGKSALVSFVRIIQQGFESKSSEETLVWQLDDEGLWGNVHLHRVALPQKT